MRGRILKALSGFYYVDAGRAGLLTCRARGKLRRENITPLVGDWVEYTEQGQTEGTVEQVLPRKNVFARPSVANIDQLVIVASEAAPCTEPFLIDRMTALAALKCCAVLICVNKCDLAPGNRLVSYYSKAGYPVVRVSARTGEGMDELRKQLTGRLSVVTGNSGVGKSSILNALDFSALREVGEVSRALGRGKHTTRHVELFCMADEIEIIDTPGFSSFHTEDVSLELKERLPEAFPDFSPYRDKCRFVGCSHTKEQGCAVLEALRMGELVPGRHESYVRLFRELKDVREWS